MNVIQERQVERLRNDEELVFGEIQGPSIVRFLDAFEKLFRDVIRVVLGGPDGESLATAGTATGSIRVLLPEFFKGARDIWRDLESDCDRCH